MVRDVNFKDISQIPKWTGNVNHESPTKYLEELKYYFKTLDIEEDDPLYIISRAIISSAEGWFHLIKNNLQNYCDL